MLAILYLIAAVWLGDVLCRRFLSFGSVVHRLSAAFVVGVLVSTWITYLGVAAFPRSPIPFLAGDVLFAAVVYVTWRFWPRAPAAFLPRPPGHAAWDLLIVAIWLAFAAWLARYSLSMQDGVIKMGAKQWSDFGATLGLVRSFSLGHNFPPEYPHYPGPPLSYHFLFHFQVANLEWLGLSLTRAFNIPSVLGLVAFVSLVMTMGERLFQSRAVGRIAAFLFFFHSGLHYVPYLSGQPSFKQAWNAVLHKDSFLDSIFPYRGEAWGIHTLNIVANQRHLPAAMSVLVIVLIFLVDTYGWRLAWPQRKKAVVVPEPILVPREAPAADGASPMGVGNDTLPFAAQAPTPEPLPYASTAAIALEAVPAPLPPPPAPEPEPEIEPAPVPGGSRLRLFASFCFAGVLLGLLPLWNGPTYLGAVAVLLALFVLLPLRGYMFALLAFAAVVGVPQLILWRAGGGASGAQTYPMLHFGYVVDYPYVPLFPGPDGVIHLRASILHFLAQISSPVALKAVLKYVAFTFGLKWLALVAALFLLRRLGVSLLVAFFTLFAIPLCLMFSIESAAGHKFLFTWVALVNVFVAYALYRMARSGVLGAVAAVVLTIGMTLGGLIDILPFVNDAFVEVATDKDPLYEWVLNETRPHDIFLTDAYVAHPILFAGRKLFFGHPYYAWGAGYPTQEREVLVKQMYSEKDPEVLIKLLNDNKIAYVCFDNTFTQGELGRNEWLVKAYLPIAFEDPDGKHDGYRIYQVPTLAQWKQRASAPIRPVVAPPATPQPPPTRLARGFGLAVLPNGEVLAAEADTGAIQRISPGGAFVGGVGLASYKEPNGVAVDAQGFIYVADTWKSRIVKLSPDGTELLVLPNPSGNYYAPRDITISAAGHIFVANTGRAQVVHYDSNGRIVAEWGAPGKEPGQFNEPLALVVGGSEVYVADYLNARIQVFSEQGKFLRMWPVGPWQGASAGARPGLAFHAGRVYAASTATNSILVFSTKGETLGTIQAPDLSDPTGLAVTPGGELFVTNTGSGQITRSKLSPQTGLATETRRFAPPL
jgi:DNA-binding beta-propeller fold protein YncE